MVAVYLKLGTSYSADDLEEGLFPAISHDSMLLNFRSLDDWYNKLLNVSSVSLQEHHDASLCLDYACG